MTLSPDPAPVSAPRVPTFCRLVVMGVAGSGKTTLGRLLAAHLHWSFLDADNCHDAAALAQMARGEGLSEAQREPWLRRVRAALEAQDHAVLACSALTRAARDHLRGAGVRFLCLVASPELLRARLSARQGHPVGPELLPSQFRALEAPTAEETDVVSLPVAPDDSPADLLKRAVDLLKPHSPAEPRHA
ncbi:gluconokinase [Deinococcus hohokamensis]|uniref:Gluconokinase n=1 Tax=Deinococcus hohokamensis TaxID=309883 RepID=A0ABV9I5D0_9DEIO